MVRRGPEETVVLAQNKIDAYWIIGWSKKKKKGLSIQTGWLGECVY